jgi:hypothetical protein
MVYGRNKLYITRVPYNLWSEMLLELYLKFACRCNTVTIIAWPLRFISTNHLLPQHKNKCLQTQDMETAECHLDSLKVRGQLFSSLAVQRRRRVKTIPKNKLQPNSPTEPLLS